MAHSLQKAHSEIDAEYKLRRPTIYTMNTDEAQSLSYATVLNEAELKLIKARPQDFIMCEIGGGSYYNDPADKKFAELMKKNHIKAFVTDLKSGYDGVAIDIAQKDFQKNILGMLKDVAALRASEWLANERKSSRVIPDAPEAAAIIAAEFVDAAKKMGPAAARVKRSVTEWAK